MNVSAQLTGFDKAFKLVTSMPRKTRYAASGAINDTLKDVQRETAERILPHAFTLRGRGKQWWEQGQRFGFNIRPYSNPNTLEGVMGSQADWLRLQEKGGVKSISGHRLAIPADDYKPRQAIMAKRIKPRSILNRKSSGAFKATFRSGFAGIFKRIGDDLKLLFSFESKAKIKKRLDFEREARSIADKRYGTHFAIRFLAGLKG